MIMITTKSVYGRADWYEGYATVKGVIYNSFAETRHGAWKGVMWQIGEALKLKI